MNRPLLETRLGERIAAMCDQPVDPAVMAFANRLAEAAGASAVLFYGSNLRTGELEGVLDFYILLPGPQRDRVWPRVSYHEWEFEGVPLRAKVATMALDTFQRAARGKSRDTTIWARFVQPCALVFAADGEARAQTIEAVCDAVCTAARLAAVLGPDRATPDEYWRTLFRATYRAEFRVEAPGREDTIIAANRAHFDGLFTLALEADRQDFATEGGIIAPHIAPEDARWLEQWWAQRARQGKAINLLRLLKATTTFEGASRYAAWKLERHTGIAVEVTPWKERHPVLAAPGVLWKVWRHKRRREKG